MDLETLKRMSEIERKRWYREAEVAEIRALVPFTDCLAERWPGGVEWQGGNRAQLAATLERNIRRAEAQAWLAGSRKPTALEMMKMKGATR